METEKKSEDEEEEKKKEKKYFLQKVKMKMKKKKAWLTSVITNELCIMVLIIVKVIIKHEQKGTWIKKT